MKIAVLGSDNRFAEIVRAFVRKTYGDGALVEAEHAEVGLIDLDAYGAGQWLADWRRLHPDRPVLVLSLRDPEDEGLVWLKKPLQIKDLTAALEGLCAPKTKVVVREDSGGAIHQAASAVGSKRQVEGIRVRHHWADDFEYYNPADYLQGYLTTAYRQAMLTGITVRLETGWEPILVFPKLRKIWTSGDDKRLYACCRVPVKAFARLGGSTVRLQPEPAFSKLPEPLQAMDAFLWKVALWNSGGRLPFGLLPDQLLRLKRWPNLTRYVHPLQALRVCALLMQKPVSPQQAAELLNLPSGEVFGLISAAWALGLVEQQAVQAEPEPSMASQRKPESRKTGFLQRILQRLVTG